jgi:activator of 2-hydroxyglutaryl-CoA dehydratase
MISSICTVFAETEATSLMAQGKQPESIALGLHHAIITRTVNMLGRVGLKHPLIFTGGVANNPCVRTLLASAINTEVGTGLLIPDNPDTVGALGAALHFSDG